jgi:hypothetical protein
MTISGRFLIEFEDGFSVGRMAAIRIANVYQLDNDQRWPKRNAKPAIRLFADSEEDIWEQVRMWREDGCLDANEWKAKRPVEVTA